MLNVYFYSEYPSSKIKYVCFVFHHFYTIVFLRVVFLITFAIAPDMRCLIVLFCF